MQVRGQTEILGLVVIVLIISVALMFVYFFSLRGGGVEETIYDQQGFAQQMVASILQTQTTCRSLDMTDIVKLCVEGNNWGTQQTCGLDDEDLLPCGYFSGLSRRLLDDSIGLLNREYKFGVFDQRGDGVVNVNSVEDCGRGATAGVFPLFTRYAGEIVIRLEICEHE